MDKGITKDLPENTRAPERQPNIHGDSDGTKPPRWLTHSKSLDRATLQASVHQFLNPGPSSYSATTAAAKRRPPLLRSGIPFKIPTSTASLPVNSSLHSPGTPSQAQFRVQDGSKHRQQYQRCRPGHPAGHSATAWNHAEHDVTGQVRTTVRSNVIP